MVIAKVRNRLHVCSRQNVLMQHQAREKLSKEDYAAFKEKIAVGFKEVAQGHAKACLLDA